MEKRRVRGRVGQFVIALLAPTAVAGFMQFTWPFFQQTPTSLFLLAVMFSAWYGGLGPGLLSLFVSLLISDYFFVAPYFAFWPPGRGNFVRLVTLVSVGSFISVLSELTHYTRRRAEDSFQSAQRADETRRLIEERYHTLFDQAPDGILIADRQSFYLDANASMCRMLGYDRDELIGLHASDIVTEPEVEHIDEALTMIKAESDYHREWHFRRKDGSVFDGEVIATAMPDGNLLGLVRDITERKQAAEKLRLSEDQFRTMANSIPQLAWIAHADGFIFWYNQRWHDYTGKTMAEMEGWGWQGVHDPQLLPKVMEGWQNAIAMGQPFEMEFPLRRADGYFRMFLTRVQPLKDSQGAVVKWFGTNTDVDELKLMQESLRRQADLLEQSYDAIFVWELGGAINYWNRGAELLYGFTKLEAIGHVTHELLQTERLTATNHFEDELKSAGRWEGELQHTARDGRKIAVESRHIVVQREGATYVLETNRDITERKRVAEDRERFFALSQDVLCVLGFDGFFTDVNPAWEKTLGYTKAELLTTPFIEFIHTDDREETLAEAEQVSSGKALIAFENRYRCKDGSYRCFQWSVTPVIEDRVMYGVARDVTERKLAEQEIQKLNTELEQRVIERTSQLEAANKELEAFSYSVSHDLRAPLRGIDGYVRMLKEDFAQRLDAEGNRLLDVVSSEAKRMGQLIDDLLTFSRLGREQMDSTTIDMTALAGAVFENLTSAASEPAPRFELKSLPAAQGDLSMLRQVFVNLIGNAGKFTRHQSAPVIEVGGATANGELTYYVKDNGVGFDEKYGHKLFGVFQRLHSEAEFEGTGVGLALVQRVIHRHGGKVWAKGKPNQGATFYFTLPIRNGHANGQSQ
jgi:PAS domain S-box-containing protein